MKRIFVRRKMWKIHNSMKHKQRLRNPIWFGRNVRLFKRIKRRLSLIIQMACFICHEEFCVCKVNNWFELQESKLLQASDSTNYVQPKSCVLLRINGSFVTECCCQADFVCIFRENAEMDAEKNPRQSLHLFMMLRTETMRVIVMI